MYGFIFFFIIIFLFINQIEHIRNLKTKCYKLIIISLIMASYDIETGEKLDPVYIAITCSFDKGHNGKTDFDSNTLASRVNIKTFTPCWQDLFFNSNERLEDKLKLSDNDRYSDNSGYLDGIYLVWSITKLPQNHYAEIEFTTPTLNRTFIGLVNEERLDKFLPNTLIDLNKQKEHYGLKQINQ